ncbi:MAG: phenylalanine--tRNA ligase subunit alpha [Clostridiaceae bacterium]|jgi:phenylalanyl-tRNA synthetase alpha chain|nr:phenylalanine--tRNA ligase subunit alpha [Clostridiaceae bacterium]
MQETIDKITRSFNAELEKASSVAELNELRVRYLGKNGVFTEVMKSLKDIAKEDKPFFGKLLNDARVKIEEVLQEKDKTAAKEEQRARLLAERIDITLPGVSAEAGSIHPLSKVKAEFAEIFTSLGFEIKEGPEVELDFFNFQLLNIPKDHPARDMQDTFYITDDVVLRTHTSPMQARVMLEQKPPIRVIIPGKVYRVDDDASHSPMFQQIEGLVVDKNISLCDLKGCLETVCKKLFSSKTKIRFRPSFFPFTEPSVEVDCSCPLCGGKGCRICKGTGWIEILGAGILNPKVLDNCGIDSSVYSGFAFGVGMERVAMIRYGIPDIRIFFENDIRFLKQYK